MLRSVSIPAAPTGIVYKNSTAMTLNTIHLQEVITLFILSIGLYLLFFYVVSISHLFFVKNIGYIKKYDSGITEVVVFVMRDVSSYQNQS